MGGLVRGWAGDGPAGLTMRGSALRSSQGRWRLRRRVSLICSGRWGAVWAGRSSCPESGWETKGR